MSKNAAIYCKVKSNYLALLREMHFLLQVLITQLYLEKTCERNRNSVYTTN